MQLSYCGHGKRFGGISARVTEMSKVLSSESVLFGALLVHDAYSIKSTLISDSHSIVVVSGRMLLEELRIESGCIHCGKRLEGAFAVGGDRRTSRMLA